jgi:CRISPR-associated protein Csd1
MLLERLADYATERLDLPPAMYQRQPIRYLLELDRNGRLLGPPIDTADPSSRQTKNGTPILAPHVKRTVGIRPKLLADRADYALGVVPPEAKPERVREQHQAFVELVRACAKTTGAAEVRSVLTFLEERLDPADPAFEPPFDRTAHVTFRVDGVLPIDLPEVQAFWAAAVGPDEGAEAAGRMPCIVCGRVRPVLRRHPIKIKGIRCGQMGGTDLISANAGAFESYGLANSLIAPTCQSCAERYANALNDLLAKEESHVRVGCAEYVFWARRPTGFSLAPLLTNPHASEVRELIRAAQTGRAAAADLDANAFYVMALDASGSRTVVSRWIDTTVGEAQRRLARYFQLQDLVNWDGSPGEPLPIRRLANATVRDPAKENPPAEVTDALLQLALGERHDPMEGLLYQAVRRCRAEQGVNRDRAVLMKMALLATHGEVNGMVQLESEHTDEAYHCGRLLAVLDAIQQRALGNPNATIVDKFYGTASSAPATVFGTLLHGVQAHLGKLRKEQPGMHEIFEQQLEAVLDRIGDFPLTLSLQRQALFALGFYHQRAADRRAIAERRAAREQRAAGAPAQVG